MNKSLYGAIIGDMIGSIVEGYQWTSWDYDVWDVKAPKKSVLKKPFVERGAHTITDDTILSLASYQAFINALPSAYCLQRAGLEYLDVGYGGKFLEWLTNEIEYTSWGNGGLMRLSFLPGTDASLDEQKSFAVKNLETTHNHPDALFAVMLYLHYCHDLRINPDARHTWWKEKIHNPTTCVQLHNQKKFAIHSLDLFYQVIHVMHEAKNFEHAMQLSCYVGGDTDTLASVVGAASSLIFDIPEDYMHRADNAIKNLNPWLTGRQDFLNFNC